MALDLQLIREALESRLSNQTNGVRGRPTNFYAHPPRFPPPPWIGIQPGHGGGRYVNYMQTFGGASSGEAEVLLTIEVGVVAFDIDQQIAMDDYLSTGTGKTSSIVAAILADRTLGGVVEECVTLEALTPEWEDSDRSVLIGRLPVQIMTRKA